MAADRHSFPRPHACHLTQSSGCSHPPPPPTTRLYTSSSGHTSLIHPLLDYYHGAAFMDRGGYRRLVRSLKAHPPEQLQVSRGVKSVGMGGVHAGW